MDLTKTVFIMMSTISLTLQAQVFVARGQGKSDVALIAGRDEITAVKTANQQAMGRAKRSAKSKCAQSSGKGCKIIEASIISNSGSSDDFFSTARAVAVPITCRPYYNAEDVFSAQASGDQDIAYIRKTGRNDASEMAKMFAKSKAIIAALSKCHKRTEKACYTLSSDFISIERHSDRFYAEYSASATPVLCRESSGTVDIDPIEN